MWIVTWWKINKQGKRPFAMALYRKNKVYYRTYRVEIVWYVQGCNSKKIVALQNQPILQRLFLHFYTLQMDYKFKDNVWTCYKREQFKNCHATITYWEDGFWNEITIFYSYTCPKLVKIRWNWYRFTFDWSRKAWSITSSRTTSKQMTNFYGKGWRNLVDYNLKEFENDYFDTWIWWLY